MKNLIGKFNNILIATAVALSIGAICISVHAATAEDLNKSADQALQTLYKTNPTAKDISKSAKAILVFPKIIKAGLVFRR